MTITRMVMMAWIAGTAAHAGEPQTKLTVYVRDKASVNPWVCVMAEELAGEMFTEIGISVEWGKGKPAGHTSQPPIFIELVTGTPAKLMPGALAYAMPYDGAPIRVFYDRIDHLPNRGRVLAHVMVHEITHVLQRICRHSGAGIMKAQWTFWDFREMAFKPLPFNTEDVELIHLGLAARMAGTSAEVAGR
jgi:hypothetical protein